MTHPSPDYTPELAMVQLVQVLKTSPGLEHGALRDNFIVAYFIQNHHGITT